MSGQGRGGWAKRQKRQTSEKCWLDIRGRQGFQRCSLQRWPAIAVRALMHVATAASVKCVC